MKKKFKKLLVLFLYLSSFNETKTLFKNHRYYTYWNICLNLLLGLILRTFRRCCSRCFCFQEGLVSNKLPEFFHVWKAACCFLTEARSWHLILLSFLHKLEVLFHRLLVSNVWLWSCVRLAQPCLPSLQFASPLWIAQIFLPLSLNFKNY